MTVISSSAMNRTLPRRQPNAAYRQREYLTESELDRLIEAARKRGRNGARDAAAILLAYRHGLRSLNSARYVGLRLICAARGCTSIGPRAGLRGFTRCMGQS